MYGRCKRQRDLAWRDVLSKSIDIAVVVEARFRAALIFNATGLSISSNGNPRGRAGGLPNPTSLLYSQILRPRRRIWEYRRDVHFQIHVRHDVLPHTLEK